MKLLATLHNQHYGTRQTHKSHKRAQEGTKEDSNNKEKCKCSTQKKQNSRRRNQRRSQMGKRSRYLQSHTKWMLSKLYHGCELDMLSKMVAGRMRHLHGVWSTQLKQMLELKTAYFHQLEHIYQLSVVEVNPRLIFSTKLQWRSSWSMPFMEKHSRVQQPQLKRVHGQEKSRTG